MEVFAFVSNTLEAEAGRKCQRKVNWSKWRYLALQELIYILE